MHASSPRRCSTTTSPDEPAAARIASWEDDRQVAVSRATATLEEICRDEQADLARMSVGLRVVRTLLG